MLSAANSFEVLELPVVVTSAADVDKAYKKLSKFVHPDKAPSDYRDKATEAFKKLGEAKEELSDLRKQKELIDEIEAEEAAEAARQAELEDLSPWQEDLVKEVRAAIADERRLRHVWDNLGGSGKTFMTRFLEKMYPGRVIVLSYSSARHAMAEVVARQDEINALGMSAIIIFDIPRSAKTDNEFYEAAEICKGGFFQAPLKPMGMKQTTMQCKLIFHPHMLVFTNKRPTKKDLECLTADRWNVSTIHPNTSKLVADKQTHRWIDEITEKRYEDQMAAIDDIEGATDDPNEQMVRDCFEVDANATEELVVQKHLHPVMEATGYDKNHISLGILLARVFEKEMGDGTIKVKKGGKKGTRYIGLKIKDDAPQPA